MDKHLQFWSSKSLLRNKASLSKAGVLRSVYVCDLALDCKFKTISSCKPLCNPPLHHLTHTTKNKLLQMEIFCLQRWNYSYHTQVSVKNFIYSLFSFHLWSKRRRVKLKNQMLPWICLFVSVLCHIFSFLCEKWSKKKCNRSRWWSQSVVLTFILRTFTSLCLCNCNLFSVSLKSVLNWQPRWFLADRESNPLGRDFLYFVVL